MNLGINNTDITFLFEVKSMNNEVLRVTPDGQFIWHPDADRLIEEGDYSSSPAMPHILRALRKRQWVGLTDGEAYRILSNADMDWMQKWCAIEAKLKEKNT